MKNCVRPVIVVVDNTRARPGLGADGLDWALAGHCRAGWKLPYCRKANNFVSGVQILVCFFAFPFFFFFFSFFLFFLFLCFFIDFLFLFLFLLNGEAAEKMSGGGWEGRGQEWGGPGWPRVAGRPCRTDGLDLSLPIFFILCRMRIASCIRTCREYVGKF